MLCRRWREALRRRHSGAVVKPPLGALFKSQGAERRWKRLEDQSGMSHEDSLTDSRQLSADLRPRISGIE